MHQHEVADTVVQLVFPSVGVHRQEQPPFLLQLLHQLRPGEGRQRTNLHRVEVVIDDELAGLTHSLRIVGVAADDEHSVDVDLRAVETLDGVDDALHRLPLGEVEQRLRIDRLVPDEHHIAAGSLHEFNELIVLRELETALC